MAKLLSMKAYFVGKHRSLHVYSKGYKNLILATVSLKVSNIFHYVKHRHIYHTATKNALMRCNLEQNLKSFQIKSEQSIQ